MRRRAFLSQRFPVQNQINICIWQVQEKILNLDKEKTLRFWHDMLEHGDGHHEGEEEGEEVEDGVELEGALQLHRLQLHLGCCGSA